MLSPGITGPAQSPRENTSLAPLERTITFVITPRGHIRPDKRGRERPSSERGRGRLPGLAEGVAHAPSSRSTIIGAASAAAENAAAFTMTATAHPLGRQWFAVQHFSRRATPSIAVPLCISAA